MPKKFYLTTAIPYVNAPPHIGFALELVQADAVARWQRQRGRDVFFLTGADENSLKNVQAAVAEGLTPQALVDRNSQRFADLAQALHITNDAFILTSQPAHHLGAQTLWRACRPDDIYRKSYQGLYCVGCEAFYLPKELVGGTCLEHRTVPERVNEENYFFRLSRYQERLTKLVESGRLAIVPETRRNEVVSFLKMGLEDFSISRSQTRAKDWGVPVPGDQDQVMYVWFDALANYLTGLGYGQPDQERFSRYWPADLHVIGKGIIRFHAVYWLAMLLSARLPLPKRIFVHGYVTVEGQKISKSLGNAVDPFALVEEFGADALRYYLLRYIHPTQDSDFSPRHLAEAYQADLAHGLGNLVSRVTGLIEQYRVPIKVGRPKAPPPALTTALAALDFNAALKIIWHEVKRWDTLMASAEPWKLAKAGKTIKLTAVLQQATNGIATVARWLEPFMPKTAEKIVQMIRATPIVKAPPLFPRLERTT